MYRHSPEGYPSPEKIQAAHANRSLAANRREGWGNGLFSGNFLNTEDRRRIVAPRYVAAFKSGVADTIGATGCSHKHLVDIHIARRIAVSGVKTEINTRPVPDLE